MLACAPALVSTVGGYLSPEVVFDQPVQERVVALSIDDGPSPATREILDVLDEYDARATFFLIGRNLLNDPQTARSIVERGSEVGHHMMTDEPSIGLDPADFHSQFDRMDRLLADLRTARLFRPGSGLYDERMVRQVSGHGYRIVLGSVYPFDAQIPSVTAAAWYIRTFTAPGAIIVLHDGPERGPRTAEVLRRVLPELQRAGYRVTTVGELLDLTDDSQPSAHGVPAAGG